MRSSGIQKENNGIGLCHGRLPYETAHAKTRTERKESITKYDDTHILTIRFRVCQRITNAANIDIAPKIILTSNGIKE